MSPQCLPVVGLWLTLSACGSPWASQARSVSEGVRQAGQELAPAMCEGVRKPKTCLAWLAHARGALLLVEQGVELLGYWVERDDNPVRTRQAIDVLVDAIRLAEEVFAIAGMEVNVLDEAKELVRKAFATLPSTV